MTTTRKPATSATTCVHIPGGVVCFANDLDDDWLKRHKGKTARDEVIEQVRRFGGFSAFWVTDNQKRAKAADALQAAGVIVRTEMGQFPWAPYRLVKRSERKRRKPSKLVL
jgi:hypothetical protein